MKPGDLEPLISLVIDGLIKGKKNAKREKNQLKTFCAVSWQILEAVDRFQGADFFGMDCSDFK